MPHRQFLESEIARYELPITTNTDRPSAYQRYSILGHMGKFIEPAVKPLGWDWRVGCAAIASFPLAKSCWAPSA